MIPAVTPDLRTLVAGALREAARRTRGPETSPLLRQIAPDLAQFHAQAAELEMAGLQQTVALMRDEDSVDPDLPVLLAPDLTDVERSYDELLATLERSGIGVRTVSPEAAERTLIDRMSEFLAVRSRKSAGGTGTLVNSRRSGDTVLYCKGFYVSTATGFGLSTPATKSIPAGRYTFGIVEPTGDRFEGLVWTCPTTVTLNLP